MTKFENPSFNSPANSQKYKDNYDRIFGITAYCSKCEKDHKVNFTGNIDGQQEEVKCGRCKSKFWILTGTPT